MKRVALIWMSVACGAAIIASIAVAQKISTAAAATAPDTMPSASHTSSHYSGRHGFSSSYALSQPQGDAMLAISPIPEDYNLLSDRNIFIKGHQLTEAHDNPRTSTFTGVTPNPDATNEANLVFSGTIIASDQSVAADIEDASSGKVNFLHVGDSIARGKITAITLDYLDYESNGKTSRVSVGQNLLGGNPVASTQPSTDTGTGTGMGTGTGTGSSGTSSSTDAILERLRQRRQAGQ